MVSGTFEDAKWCVLERRGNFRTGYHKAEATQSLDNAWLFLFLQFEMLRFMVARTNERSEWFC
jgi:hypothetical protein